jgi:hypothetical protein
MALQQSVKAPKKADRNASSKSASWRIRSYNATGLLCVEPMVI